MILNQMGLIQIGAGAYVDQKIFYCFLGRLHLKKIKKLDQRFKVWLGYWVI